MEKRKPNPKDMPDLTRRVYQIIEERYNGTIKSLASIVGESQQNVSRLFYPDKRSTSNKYPTMPNEIIDKLQDKLGVRKEWVYTGKGEMYIDEQIASEKKPHIIQTAAAGSLSESITAESERMDIIPFVISYDFTIEVRGDSMEPEYRSGDVVACRKLSAGSFRQWGKPHVLATAQGIIIKRIYDDGDSIRCVSYNEEYKPFNIPKNEIYDMALVVGSVRRF